MAAAIIFLSLSGIAKAKEEEKSADPKQTEIQSILNAFEDIEQCEWITKGRKHLQKQMYRRRSSLG